jgi:hypothetical protein
MPAAASLNLTLPLDEPGPLLPVDTEPPELPPLLTTAAPVPLPDPEPLWPVPPPLLLLLLLPLPVLQLE